MIGTRHRKEAQDNGESLTLNQAQTPPRNTAKKFRRISPNMPHMRQHATKHAPSDRVVPHFFRPDNSPHQEPRSDENNKTARLIAYFSFGRA
jgi:hypothetical protein